MSKLKKTIIWLVVAVLALGGVIAGFVLSNRGEAVPAAPAKPVQPTPVPTPEPEGMQLLFGKEISVALLSASKEFSEGAMAEAATMGLELAVMETAAEAQGFDLVLLCGGEADHESLEMPVVLFTTDAGQQPAAGCRILYNSAAELESTLDVVLHFVSHEAPVRLVAMYAAGGAGTVGVQKMQQEGKFYLRGECSGTDLKPDLMEKLNRVTVGLLDTVFAETPELAMQGFEVLKEAERGDAVEIIACGLNAEIAGAMVEEHFLMGAGTGANLWGAGALALRMGISMLSGEEVAGFELQPFTLYSEDVITAWRAGQQDMCALVRALDAPLEEAFQTQAVEYMRQYYGPSQG